MEKEQGNERERWVEGELTWPCSSLDLSSRALSCYSTIVQAVHGHKDACQHQG